MKIEVGKIYKDGYGGKVKIVVNLDKNMPSHPAGYTFIGQNDDGLIKAYNSEGKCHWVNSDKEHLLPNTVKKEGWINLWKFDAALTPGGRMYNNKSAADSAAAGSLFPTKRLAAVRVEWEEEENL